MAELSGRFVLHRNTSLNASMFVADESLDIVFLDARHDYEASRGEPRALFLRPLGGRARRCGRLEAQGASGWHPLRWALRAL